ncbi:MAG: sugar phosphate isomerase/epimerase family protein [Candidatus Hydrothermarchaeaceae archaeon]
MKLGAMNNPEKIVTKEIKLFGDMEFDFVDLAIEGPRAGPEKLAEEEREIRDLLSTYDMFAVAHVPWFFDIGHPYEAVQEAFLKEAHKVIKVAAKFEIEKIGLHILKPKGLFEDKLGLNIKGIKEIVRKAENYGIAICIENLDFSTFSIDDFRQIFKEVPEAKFLYDIGHANLGIREEGEIFLFLRNFKDKLIHIHAHDNLGGTEVAGDLHLPIGVGNIDWKKMVNNIKKVYHGTITLEIHARDRDYLRISREKFLRIWK